MQRKWPWNIEQDKGLNTSRAPLNGDVLRHGPTGQVNNNPGNPKSCAISASVIVLINFGAMEAAAVIERGVQIGE